MNHPLYSEMVLEHYKRPRHQTLLENPQHEVLCANPLCGDQLAFQSHNHSSGELLHLGWQGKGCALCIASTSLLVDYWHIQKPSNSEFSNLLQKAHAFLMSPSEPTPFLKYNVFQTVHQHPSRIKCAALACRGLSELLAKPVS